MPSAADDYFAALERLVQGEPTHEKNRELASKGKLSITPSSVAREAGRSRTPIAKEDCDLPNVRKAILKAGGRAASARSRRTKNRNEIDELKDQNRILQLQVSRMATLLVDAAAELRDLETTIFKLKDSLKVQHEATPVRPGLLGIRGSDPSPGKGGA